MATGQNNPMLGYLQLLAIASFIFLISACGGGNEANSNIASDTDAGTGALSFEVALHNADDGIQQQATDIDCASLGIATVEAMVYDQGNNFLINGGPWLCEEGQYAIYDVPAGSGIAVTIAAKNVDGNLILRGNKTDIDVVAESDNIAGTIPCYAFVAGLLYPENDSVVPADAAELQWDVVTGASEYLVIVSKNDDLSDSFVNATVLENSYALSDLTIGETYFWQVIASDGDGNPGIGSPIWSFTTEN